MYVTKVLKMQIENGGKDSLTSRGRPRCIEENRRINRMLKIIFIGVSCR